MSTLLSPTASTTVDAIRLNVLRQVDDVPYTDTHTSSAAASGALALTVASDATTRWEVGDLGEWRYDNTGEVVMITAVAATTLSVSAAFRGFLGTTAATHASNALLTKIPRFYADNVRKSVQDSLDNDLYPELFCVYEEQLTHGSTSWAAVSPMREVEAATEDVLYAYQKSDQTPTVWLDHEAGLHISEPRYSDSTTAASKKVIEIRSVADPDNAIFLQSARVPAIGDLSKGMVQVVEYGAMERLTTWKGIWALGKVDILQSGTQAPGAHERTARALNALKLQARAEERARLTRRFPVRRRRVRYRHYTDKP